MGISKGTMVAATRREAWFLLLSLILGVQAMPMSLDSGAQVFLAEVASQDPGTGELNCHTKTDQSDKLACCKDGLETWRGKQALYQDYDSAETDKMSAAEETEALIAAADAAKAKWEQSETKRILRRACGSAQTRQMRTNFRRIRGLPQIASRRRKRHPTRKSPLPQKQGEAMADYVKVANGIDAE